MTRDLGRGLVLVGLAVCLAWLAVCAAPAAAAAAVWSPVPMPPGAAWTVRDAWAFGETGLALAGDGGHVAVTQDGGGTWKDVVVNGLGGTSFSAVALTTSGHGVVASGGLHARDQRRRGDVEAATYSRTRPGRLDRRRRHARRRGRRRRRRRDDPDQRRLRRHLAAGDLADHESASPHVALAGDGTAVAGAVSGEILVRSAGAWTVAGVAAGPVTAVAAGAAPVWGDGEADLYAATGADVLGSDDALTFASLPGLPDPSTQPWSALTLVGGQAALLLLAGAGQAGFLGLLGQVLGLRRDRARRRRRPRSPPASRASPTCSTPTAAWCRTLAPAGIPHPSRSRGAASSSAPGHAAVGHVRVAAPGTVVLRTRVPGRPWTTLRRVPWNAGGLGPAPVASSSARPSPTTTRWTSSTAGPPSRLAPVDQVVVVPRITTSRSRYDLRRGDVFRFSGTVAPQLRGERVELFTDRGGGWRPVSLQRSVALRDGRTWTSRQFGTPNAETYRLRAHLPRTRTHAEAWSRIVTVTIR